MALALARWPKLHELAAACDQWQPGQVGAPAHYPAATFFVWGAMQHAWVSEREVESELATPSTWEPIRRHLRSLYPGYKGLEARNDPPNRSQFRRFCNTYLSSDNQWTALSDNFSILMIEVAKGMGMLDGSKGSLTNPSVGNMLLGDGVHMRSLYRGVKGDLQIDRVTGEIQQRRYDPDARYFRASESEDQYDEEDSAFLLKSSMHRRVLGLKFVNIHVTNKFPKEHLVLAVANVRGGPGNDEAAVAIRELIKLKSLAPEAQGVCWDAILRGTHIRKLYDVGMLTAVKTHAEQGGAPRERLIEVKDLNRGTGRPRLEVHIWAIAGTPHLEVVSSRSTREYVPLTRLQIKGEALPTTASTPSPTMFEWTLGNAVGN